MESGLIVAKLLLLLLLGQYQFYANQVSRHFVPHIRCVRIDVSGNVNVQDKLIRDKLAIYPGAAFTHIDIAKLYLHLFQIYLGNRIGPFRGLPMITANNLNYMDGIIWIDVLIFVPC